MKPLHILYLFLILLVFTPLVLADVVIDVPDVVNVITGNLTLLGQLIDVTIPSPNNAEVLTFNSTSVVWESQTVSAGAEVDPFWTANSTLYPLNTSFNTTQFLNPTTTANITISESFLDGLFTTISEVLAILSGFFDQDLNTTSDVIFRNLTVNNITVDFIFGDGSQLTGLASGDGNASSICNGNFTFLDGDGTCQPLTSLSNFSDNLGHVQDNQSWNQSRIVGNVTLTNGNLTADFLFGNGSQLTGLTLTETDPLWTANSTTVARVGDCPAGQFVQNTTTGGVECAIAAGSGDITSVQGDEFITNGSDSGDVNLVFNVSLAGTNLSVNSSDFWDNLDTPSDINAGDITDDGTYLLATGDTATGNYTFDSTTLHIDSTNNRVGVGTTIPLAPFEIQSLAASMRQTRYATVASQSAGITVQRSGGTTVGTDVIVEDDWRIANFNLRGYDGAVYRTAASIQASIDGTPGAGDMPGRLTFLTTADGDSSATERLRIDSSGNVGIGTATPQQTLNVFGDLNVTGNNILNLNWTFLQNYPTACTSSQFISVFGDTLTCAAISITASQISDFSSEVINILGGFHNQDLNTTDDVTFRNLTVNNVTADFYFGDGSQLQNLGSGTEPLWTANSTIYPLNQSFNSTQFTTTSNITIQESWLDSLFTTVSEVFTILNGFFDQDLNTTSNVQFRNLTVNNITADFLFGDGSQLNNLPSADGNASSICDGTTTYLDGEGNCDTLNSLTNFTDNLGHIEDNETWNQTFADGRYLQSFTETDPHWTGNFTNVAFTNVNETFDQNITVESVHFENDETNHFIVDNATCIIIQGDTSRWEIC